MCVQASNFFLLCDLAKMTQNLFSVASLRQKKQDPTFIIDNCLCRSLIRSLLHKYLNGENCAYFSASQVSICSGWGVIEWTSKGGYWSTVRDSAWES